MAGDNRKGMKEASQTTINGYQRPVQVVKAKDVVIREVERLRSEISLLEILIDRNPKRAAVFLKRLGFSLVNE